MKKLFIVTGELSGDTHAAAVVEQIRAQGGDIEVEAIGGANLRELLSLIHISEPTRPY